MNPPACFVVGTTASGTRFAGWYFNYTPAEATAAANRSGNTLQTIEWFPNGAPR